MYFRERTLEVLKAKAIGKKTVGKNSNNFMARLLCLDVSLMDLDLHFG